MTIPDANTIAIIGSHCINVEIPAVALEIANAPAEPAANPAVVFTWELM